MSKSAFAGIVAQLQGEIPPEPKTAWRRVHVLSDDEKRAGAEATRRKARAARDSWEREAVRLLAEDPGLLMPELIAKVRMVSPKPGGDPHALITVKKHLAPREAELRRKAARS